MIQWNSIKYVGGNVTLNITDRFVNPDGTFVALKIPIECNDEPDQDFVNALQLFRKHVLEIQASLKRDITHLLRINGLVFKYDQDEQPKCLISVTVNEQDTPWNFNTKWIDIKQPTFWTESFGDDVQALKEQAMAYLEKQVGRSRLAGISRDPSSALPEVGDGLKQLAAEDMA